MSNKLFILLRKQTLPGFSAAILLLLMGCSNPYTENARLKSQISELESRISQLEDGIQDVRSAMDDIKQSSDDLRGSTEELIGNVSYFRDGGTDWRYIVPNVEFSTDAIGSAVSDLETKIDDLESQLSDLEN